MNPYESAITKLQDLISTAVRCGIPDANAAALATSDSAGSPSVRMINIAHVSYQGLLIFANAMSGKAQHMRQNPRVGLCFYWRQPLQTQVIIEGEANILDAEEADRYWKKRSRDSRLAAWASEQTEPYEGAEKLSGNLEKYKQAYTFSAVPRPSEWVGFWVVPDRMEFWPSGWHRLRAKHRFYRDEDGNWVAEVANP